MIQRTFQVLPTDQRFIDLTEEQKDLIFENLKLDLSPSTSKGIVHDPDYDKEGPPVQERYEDPDFDKAWDADDEDGTDDSILIPQNPPELVGQDEDMGDNVPSLDDKTAWEEV